MNLQDQLFKKYIKTLQDWRNDDQQDKIVLTRNEVCVLLDGIEKYENRPR